ncbi:hypothetical protein QYF36_019665 [Acer negundo]|nr:hypothetical protein QYF36_019665 [Acer negundo]
MAKLEPEPIMATMKRSANITYYCEPYEMVMFAGSLTGEMDLINFPLLSVLLPVALDTCFAAIFRVLLKPIGQAGIVLGPSCLGQTVSSKLYWMRSISVLNVFEALGIIYILFSLSASSLLLALLWDQPYQRKSNDIANIGRLIDLNSIGRNSFLAIGWLILASMFARFFVVIITSIFYKLPIDDAVSLSLLLNCRGLIDTPVYAHAYLLKLVTCEVFGILMIAATPRSAVITPLTSATYDSSRRYVAYRRRTIQHSRRHPELCILACFYEPDNAPTIVNILEASNRPQRSVALHVMKLEELAGGTMPQVIAHRLDRLSSSHKADPMINAFRQYEEQKKGYTIVQCFTVIAPYATMHDEICLMAFERSTPLVIIPIQKPKSTFVKTVVRNDLQMSPCSVGILLDRWMFMDPRPIFSRAQAINTCVIFMGGQDDREALAYGANVAETNTTMLKIIRLVAMNLMPPDLIEEGHDLNMLNEFRTSTREQKR